MEAPNPATSRWHTAASVVVAMTLVVAVAAAVTSTVEALEERQVVAAAADLKFAALTVSAAETGPAHEETLHTDDLPSSLAVLRGDRELGLHALTPAERIEAEGHLDDLAECAEHLIEPDGAEHPAHDHAVLQALLETASGRATTDATMAEQRALAAVVAALSALVMVAWLVLRARFRSAKERAVEAAQLRAGRRFERMLDDSPEILLVIDEDGVITYRSASAGRLVDPETRTCSPLLDLVPDPDRERLRDHLRRHECEGVDDVFELTDQRGEHLWFELRVSDLTDDDLVAGHLVTARDITEEVLLREELFRQATTDVLTGLPNRRALDPTLDTARRELERSQTMVALVALDLDGFKGVNDTLGHQAGDELLTRVADRLGRTLRPGETLLRLGGDEFAAILPSVSEAGAALAAGERLLRVLDEPFRIGPRIEHLRTSIGVAVTADPSQIPALVSSADAAMYEAKRGGGDRVVVFEPGMESEAAEVGRIARALRAADHDSEFSLVYQPIVTADTGHTVSHEALLRWDSPTLGQVVPDVFIPVAETSGEIGAIGEWVLNEACRQQARWYSEGLDPDVTISLNVSARQLEDEGFVSVLLRTVAANSIPPERLVVEVTESSVLDHGAPSLEPLERLRRAGVRIAIDDFGSGYSNLGQLLRVPLDIVKVDRSLLLTLSAMRENAGDDAEEPCAIMEAIVSIAQVLHAPVVCEGVETERQRDSLRASGVTHIQGYLTGRPVSPAWISNRLARGAGRSESAPDGRATPLGEARQPGS